MNFVDLPTERRLDLRRYLENKTGMEIAGYVNNNLQVAFSNRMTISEQISIAHDMGLLYTGGCLFPICSDNPAAHLRHYGSGSAAAPRGDRPSYWHYGNFTVQEPHLD